MTIRQLAGLEQPLEAAIAVVGEPPYSKDQLRFLGEAFNAFGARLAARQMTALRDLAETVHGAGQSAAARAALGEHPSSLAALWITGCLHEFEGALDQACAIWQLIPDTRGETGAIRLTALARAKIRAKQPEQAWAWIREAARHAATVRSLRALHRLMKQCRQAAPAPARRQMRIALAGSSTLDLLPEICEPILLATGVDATFYVAPYNQYRQEILSPASGMAAFAPEMVVLMPEWRSLGLANESADPDADIAGCVEEHRRLWRECRSRFSASVVQCNYELPVSDPYGRLSMALAGGRKRVLTRLNLALWQAASEEPGVAILDLDEAAAMFGKSGWDDPVTWHMAKQYPCQEALPVLARSLAAVMRAAAGLTFKCLALDLDGVLWGGVIGEDGLQGIELGGTVRGEAFRAFQQYVRSLKERGILLAVCSKNNEADALLPFEQHPEMALKRADFAAFLANWDAKDVNLCRIAAQLNIGVDSLVFADDNPVERALIRQNLPDIEVIELPADPALYAATIHATGCFEALTLTAEDRLRTESIRQNSERQMAAASSANLEEYLFGLGMKATLDPFDLPNLPRIVQLINKTNQFNLTTRRRTEAEVRPLLERGDCYTQAMRLRDRFGDSGLTGVLIAFLEGDTLRIDNWLISCRVLGRGVEQLMLSATIDFARRAGCRQIVGEYLPTAKNHLVGDIYDRFGFEIAKSESSGARVYHADPETLNIPKPAYLDATDSTQVLQAQASSAGPEV